MYTKNYTKTFGDGAVTTVTRYIADDGKMFFDGENYWKVVDEIIGLVEVDEPTPEDEEASAEDYEAALGRFGV